MSDSIKSFIEENKDGIFKKLKELCLIPAPSHKEEKRAQFCKETLESFGAKGVYIDDALNVIFPLNCENSNEITVFAAHTDTVFPGLEPLPYTEDDGKIYCPGVGDDTSSVIAVLYIAKYFIENNIVPAKGVLFVLNSGEEGLGNLKGTKKLFKDFEGRVSYFITFDSNMDSIANRCAGSHRYEVEVKTEGGHSYNNFGNANAIHEISKIINEIYKIEVPQKEGEKTTYNVGTIEGGTSVNSIAQSAKMLCEYRSSDRECLAVMKAQFERIFEAAKSDKVSVNVVQVGDRPCSNIDFSEIDKLEEVIVPCIEEVTGKPVIRRSASTDCNIPLSLGIPSLCIGNSMYEGMHTREEFLYKDSVAPGMEIAIKAARALAEYAGR
ncbi:MAG: M20/M25/M40 family metallo-hydrolase [Clostridia bacterium]|nr:M20/M25/M40 family metallo-hydrolase [Clostridia bacterium]